MRGCGRDWSGTPTKQRLMFFVGGWLLTKEAPALPTKTQPVQGGYSGKPALPPLKPKQWHGRPTLPPKFRMLLVIEIIEEIRIKGRAFCFFC